MWVYRLLSLMVPVLTMVLVFPGCYWSQSVLQGNADVEMEIPCSDIGRILSVTNRLMETDGYYPTADATNQEIPFVIAHPHGFGSRVACYIHSGRDRIWIVAEPTGYGWRLFCLPEPQGYDTSFSRAKFRRILESVRRECVNPGKKEELGFNFQDAMAT
jgi:hypothetical protein